MRTTTMRLLLLALLCCGSARATPQQELDEALQKSQAAVNQLGRLIEVSGDPVLREVYRNTRFAVAKTQVANVSVSNKPGGPVILLAAEYRLLLTYLADLGYTETPEFADCTLQYRLYVTKALAGQIVGDGGANRIFAPEEFARLHSRACAGFERHFPIPLRYRPARDASVDAAVSFALLHELGHIALGHRRIDFDVLASESDEQKRMQQFLALSRKARDQENSADEWATDRFVALGAKPADLVTSAFVESYMAYTGLDCQFEKGYDHANGLARLDRIFHRFTAQYEKSGERRVEEPFRSLMTDLLAFAQKARAQLDCDR